MSVLHQRTLDIFTPSGAVRKTVRAVVFDCDGLLMDSESVWLDLIQHWMASHSPPVRLSLDDFHGLTVVDTARLLYQFTSQHSSSDYPDAEAIQHDITRQYSALLAKGVPLMPGAKVLLTQLQGQIPVAMASNGLKQDVMSMLNSTGLTSFFDAICTLDDVTEGKPQPEIYQLACHKLSVAPAQAIAFEDSPTGARAALAAGMTVVGVSAKPDLVLPTALRVSSLTQVSLSSP